MTTAVQGEVSHRLAEDVLIHVRSSPLVTTSVMLEVREGNWSIVDSLLKILITSSKMILSTQTMGRCVLACARTMMIRRSIVMKSGSAGLMIQ